MKVIQTLFGMAFCVAVSGCSADVEEATASRVEQPLAGAQAAGSVPQGLPGRVMVGLFEDAGATWMKSSGVRWDARYRYFTKGWVNNWGWSAYDGSWGLEYMRECDAQGYVPAVQYYQMNGEAGGNESAFYAKAQNATTMKGYFGDFKLLMQRAKDFGKPVVVLLEADGFAFLQRQSAWNPNAPAAVAATGLPELSSLPNTVAGWGLAFLQIKKAVGASKVVLGVHISAWASDKDIAYSSVSEPLGPEVEKVYTFLAPLGLGPNATGTTFDVLVGDPLDRDADFYRANSGEDRWWDVSDAASISSKSFNRYAEWLRLWNVKASKRWVLWQIPLGNSNHLNVANAGAARQGYKDNRAEYFFNTPSHVAKFADSGVIALLFGAGASGQSSFQNDTYSDGQLYMKSRAGQFLNAGGLPINSGPGSGSGGGGSGGASGTGGSTGTGGTSTSGGSGAGGSSSTGGSTGSSDPAQYNFESGSQGFTSSAGMITGVASSTVRAFAGSRSLEVSVNATTADRRTVFVSAPNVGPGKVVTFRVFVPAGSKISSVQPFVQQGAAGGWTWTGNWRAISSLSTGTFNSISLTVPSNASALAQLGVELTTSAAWAGKVYVDAISW